VQNGIISGDKGNPRAGHGREVQSGLDPELLMQTLMEKAMTSDAVAERVARQIMGFASHWHANRLALELVRE
jgi:hypothetical protein